MLDCQRLHNALNNLHDFGTLQRRFIRNTSVNSILIKFYNKN